jgi:hypothetical protein
MQLGIVKKYFEKVKVVVILFWYFCIVVIKRFLVVRSSFFERHGWVMKEATIFSREDVPT